MASDWYQHQPDDHHDDLDALYSFSAAPNAAAHHDSDTGWAALVDYSAPNTNAGHESAVDAFDAYQPVQPIDTRTELEAVCAPTEDQTDTANDASAHLSTVTNPPASVSVTAVMDGRILQVDLSEKVTTMSESELADEILALADLARHKGLSSQHTFLLDTMQSLGATDTRAIREFLEEGLNLSSPEQAAQAQADVFATRYNVERND